MSATGFLDACGFIPASNGTGNFVVSAAVQGYQTPATAGAVNATVYSYRAESSDKTQWEEGFGAYTVSGTTLARATITANSSGGATAINFSAAPNVFITALSADLQNASLLTSGTVPAACVPQLSTASGSAPSFSARAFVSFNGSTASIIASGNVASVTRTGAGLYTVTFMTPMPSTAYAVVGSVQESGASSGLSVDLLAAPSSASSFSIRLLTTAGTTVDSPYVSLAVFA